MISTKKVEKGFLKNLRILTKNKRLAIILTSVLNFVFSLVFLFLCVVVSFGLKTKLNYKVYTRFNRYIAIPVIMAVRIHLFPFRTQKLSSLAPRVLAF